MENETTLPEGVELPASSGADKPDVHEPEPIEYKEVAK